MRFTRALLLLATLGLVVSASVAYAANAPLVVRDVDMSGFPKVTLQLSLPSSLLGDGNVEPSFQVHENGRSAVVVGTSQPRTDPIDVVLVIDTSGSMKGQSLEAAKSAAQAFVSDLQSGSRVAVVAFADRPRVASPLGVGGGSLSTAISTLDAGGETAMYDALVLAATEASRAGARHPVIVLLSDGGDTVSRASADTALKTLKGAKAPVLVVALPSAESDFKLLRSISSQTGGRFSTVAGAEQLVAFYQSLARELQTTWNVTFTSNRPSTKDLEVSVSAKVGDQIASGSTLLPNPLFDAGAASKGPVLTVPPASRITLLWAAALLFASVFAFVMAAILTLLKPKTGLDQLKYYDQMTAAGDSEDAQDHSSVVTSSVLGAIDYVAGKRGIKRLAYEQLEHAGFPLRPIEYITMHMLGVIAVGVVVEFLSGNLGISVLAIMLATALPLVWLDSRVRSRRKAFDEQLPDVLNLMAGSLRAGWGLAQSLELVVEQAAPPLSTEFSRAITETRLGRPVEEALDAVATRMQSDDFIWAVTAIGIQRDVGGNLAEVLDVVAATIRDRGALNRQISGLTAEGRLSAWVLILLPFFLTAVLSLENPQYLGKLFSTVPGLLMLLAGVALLIIGAIWLRRVVEIEV